MGLMPNSDDFFLIVIAKIYICMYVQEQFSKHLYMCIQLALFVYILFTYKLYKNILHIYMPIHPYKHGYLNNYE